MASKSTQVAVVAHPIACGGAPFNPKPPEITDGQAKVVVPVPGPGVQGTGTVTQRPKVPFVALL